MGRKKQSKVAKARQNYERVKKTSKPGEGKRFAAMSKLVEAGGAKDPDAVAAMIGRKKYGKKRFQEMASAGKSRASRKRKS